MIYPACGNSGFLVMFVLGAIIPWRLATLPGAFLPIVPVVLVYYIPETPAWLLSRFTFNNFLELISEILTGEGWKMQQTLYAV